MDTTIALVFVHLVIRPYALRRVEEELVVASDSARIRAGTSKVVLLRVLCCTTGLAAARASRLFIAGTRPVWRGLVVVGPCSASHAVVPFVGRFVGPASASAVAPSTMLHRHVLRSRGGHIYALFQAA